MAKQKTLRFSLTRAHGQMAVHHRIDEQLLNHHRDIETPRRKVSSHTLRSQFLKRFAREAMANVTECPTESLPANLRLLEWAIQAVEFNLRHEFRETPEFTLNHTPHEPVTLQDFLFCMKHTRKTHRAPAYVSQRSEDIAQINRKLDTLAGLLAQNPEALELFQRQFNDAQREAA